ncbi:MAG: hypothetical protein K8R54_02100 [Bacteroidales bacterium]|nr:hypothetical protein [Bacteroidales bacterium]
MEKKLVLCDTNIFIHWFNNHQPTIDKLQTIGLDKIAVSVITVMELIEGVDNKQQLQQLKKKIKNYFIIDFKLFTYNIKDFHFMPSIKLY